MIINSTDVAEKDKEEFNRAVNHPLQSYEWGEFREKTGIKVIKKEIYDKDKKYFFQLTIHPIPHTPFKIGYLPKWEMPDKKIIEELKKIGIEENCIFIQLEPNVEKMTDDNPPGGIQIPGLVHSAHPLFTKYTFVLDLTKSEDELLKNMHPKTRYNIKLAQKHGVEVKEDNSPQAFEDYLKLMEETTKRQKFYAHTKKYHRLLWQTLNSNSKEIDKNKLSAHLFIASVKQDNKIIPLTAWILFIFKDTLYYPYGASSVEHRNLMASNLIMWEAIKFGKKLGLKKFDMWGALGENPDKNDPWYGFHRFKEGYGTRHVEFIGSYDLPVNIPLYNLYKIADKIRWLILRLKRN